MALERNTIEAVKKFWGDFFGCAAEELERPGVRVIGHAGELREYRGAWAFRFGEGVMLSVPAVWVSRVRGAVEGRGMEEVYSETALRGLFGEACETVIGPCVLMYADGKSVRAKERRFLRRLIPADQGVLKKLQASCEAEEWEQSGIEFNRDPIFGCFDGKALSAAASYEVWSGQVAHVGLITVKDRRRKGFGAEVGAAATSDAIARGLVPQWRALESNSSSLAAAESLGYQRVASHFAVRLKG
jgi:hypothetical protein